jgi:hypothetical protein
MKKGDLVITVSGRTGVPAILAVDACIHEVLLVSEIYQIK